MTVFALLGATNFEGETLIGIYSTHKLAEASYTQYCLEHLAFDEYHIYEVELDDVAKPWWK